MADTVCYHFSGTADVTIDGVFHSGEEFGIDVCIDDTAVDQIGEDARGGFSGAITTLTLADPSLMIQNKVATNINGIRQDQNPNAIFLTNDSNFFNQGFSAIFTTPGTIVDANSINPLSVASASANWQGAGLTWNFEGGKTFQFNQAANITVANLTSVPEPSCAVLLTLLGLGLAARRGRTKK